MSAQKASRGAASPKSGGQAAAKPKAAKASQAKASSKAAAGKASAPAKTTAAKKTAAKAQTAKAASSKTSAAKPAAKAKKAPARTVARTNAPVTQRADGLPVYITDEMIDTARAMQHEYGHPAGCTIAQIIQESGQGTTLSMLAERDNNLFGMKWVDSFAGKHGVVGPVEWGTDEEYDGKTVAIKDAFIEFESKKACIEFRSSVFLQSSTYADNATIRRAIETRNSALMAWGLQDAGWATDSSYAEHLVAVMDRYDLYRFDS